MRFCWCVVAGLGLQATAVVPAWGQEEPLPLDRFNPSAAGDRFFGTASPYAPGHLTFHAMALGEYSHAPLVLRDSGGEEIGSIVEHQLFLHLNASYSLLNRLSFNLDVPIALFQDGDNPVVGTTTFTSPSGTDLGDIRFGVRARLYGEPDGWIQVGVGAYLWAASGRDRPGSFVGNGTVRGKPYLALGGSTLRFIWALEIGPEVRKSQTFLGVPQGTLLCLNLANGVVLGEDRRVQLTAELAGALLPDDVQELTTNAEALAGVKWRFVDDFVVGAAAGPGFFKGIGTPDVRAVMSVAYTPAGWMEDH